jgi:hypothetical protein
LINLGFMVAAAEVVDEHLFDWFVVGDEDVADGASADEVADFFGEIFGVIAGALERLGHEDDLQAGLARHVFGILDVAQEDEIAQAVHVGVGAEYLNGLADVALGERGATVSEHLFEQRGHLRELAGVFGVDASADRLRAVGEVEQEVADALEANHELHAGEKFARLTRADLSDGSGDSVVDFEIKSVEFAFALAQRTEQGGGPGSNAFCGGAGGLFGHVAGFHGAAHDVMVSRFWIRALDCCTHECVRRARTRATTRSSGTVAGILPFL